ncbi:proline dehydrogenase family protein [Paenibacillus pinihumi]|uniref:proline dehydrogenase family protein n=1 Tax=Paenibacillus pinihumi TaxID=669462 RepID=UPI00056578A2|nr:proline dehydrogenase family protein [Paenibacillus pinihumi]
MAIMRNMLLYLSKNRTANRAAKRFGLRFGADRFVAGQTLEKAMEKVKELNDKGIKVTLDHLGEYVFSIEEAEAAASAVVRALAAIHESGADANVSVKLTQLGLDLSYDKCLYNMRGIVAAAKRHRNFVRIDMEDYVRNERTLAMYETLSSAYGPYVGVVLQAYLYKTEKDMIRMKKHAPNYRLVKGAYKEDSEVAFPKKEDVDLNFIKVIELQLRNGHFAAIATHDEQIINHVKQFVQTHNIPRSKFEFQMLYGIRPMLQQQLVKEGYGMRVYVPYGVDWYGYFMRRLAERPENVSFVVKSMLKR